MTRLQFWSMLFLLSFIFLMCLMVTSCATPDQWKPEDHRRMMMQCRVTCGKDRVKSYDAWTAECECVGKG